MLRFENLVSIILLLPLLAIPTYRGLPGNPPEVGSFTATPDEVYNDGKGNISFTLTPVGSENISEVWLNLTPIGGGVVEMMEEGGVYIYTYLVPRDYPPGEYNISAQVIDNESDAKTVSVFVRILQYNRAPVLSPTFNSTITLEEDSPPYTVNLTEVFSDPDGDVLVYTLWWDGEGKGTFFSTNLANITINGSELLISLLRNAYGRLNFSVIASDGVYSQEVRINLTVLPVNDPPTVEINSLLIPTRVDLGDSIVLIGSAEDPDGDPLNYTWISSLQGVLGYGDMIRATLSVPGHHNITLRVSDGVLNATDHVLIEVVASEENETFSGEDLRKSYTDPEGDEIWWELDTSFYYTYHKNSKPAYDILRIDSEKDGDYISVTITTKGDIVNASSFVVYFVKGYFTEVPFMKDLPSSPTPNVEDGLIFSTEEVSCNVEVKGNKIVYKIPLSVLKTYDIKEGDDFEIFVVCFNTYEKEDILEGGILDTAGFGAKGHEVEEGEKVKSPLGDIFKWAMIICGVAIIIVILIVVLVVYYFIKKRRKSEVVKEGWVTPPSYPEDTRPPEYPYHEQSWESTVWTPSSETSGEGISEGEEGSKPDTET
ncbi:MAG: hypothetical protein J7L88_00410 [Thermoplasmata archaeon]|nr:hypothetical protein [Thermoplasmata archaeon]